MLMCRRLRNLIKAFGQNVKRHEKKLQKIMLEGKVQAGVN
jgi:hypothetical protein